MTEPEKKSLSRRWKNAIIICIVLYLGFTALGWFLHYMSKNVWGPRILNGHEAEYQEMGIVGEAIKNGGYFKQLLKVGEQSSTSKTPTPGEPCHSLVITGLVEKTVWDNEPQCKQIAEQVKEAAYKSLKNPARYDCIAVVFVSTAGFHGLANLTYTKAPDVSLVSDIAKRMK